MSTTIADSDVFPSVSMPVTVVLIGILAFIIVAGFLSLFFWRFLLNRLHSAWNLQQTPYAADLTRVGNRGEEKTGLDPVIIGTFPVFRYSSAAVKDGGGMECAICLSEFTDEDRIRLITVCCHAFHSNCIDLWFESHKTCPVCRCELIRSHDESLHSTVTVSIPDEDNNNPTTTTSSSKRLTTAWRFSRSHSTGHFMVKMTDINSKIKRKHYQTGSCVSFDELTRYNEAAEYGMAW